MKLVHGASTSSSFAQSLTGLISTQTEFVYVAEDAKEAGDFMEGKGATLMKMPSTMSWRDASRVVTSPT